MKPYSKQATIAPAGPTHRQLAREQEVLRIVADLAMSGTVAVVQARNQVLTWAKNKAVGKLPDEAWSHRSFDHLAGGRNCSALRLETPESDIWALRIEDPDKNVPGRIWTTEINIVAPTNVVPSNFSLRLSASTPETTLEIEPHVPGVVKQLIGSPGLSAGNYKLVDRPVSIAGTKATELFLSALLDASRKMPIIALSALDEAFGSGEPLLDAKQLASACAGLAIVAKVSRETSWAITERFGKQLSVYNGAARVYLPGFKEDANPFGGHELVLPHGFDKPEIRNRALTRLRWIAATGSVRRLLLGTDINAFSALRAQELERRQVALQYTGATRLEQLDTANQRIALLETQLKESERYQTYFSESHEEAERRAEGAEAQLRASAFRIQQLLEQLESSGVRPDAQINLPTQWQEFANWCDINLVGRVTLAPQARRSLKDAKFQDVPLASRCLLWLANSYRSMKKGAGEGSLRDLAIENGVINTHCGSDTYHLDWQGNSHEVAWHIKSGGNSHDPTRCLRIYYFWDDFSEQAVITSLPNHRRTDAT